jgi:hypothetical protein
MPLRIEHNWRGKQNFSPKPFAGLLAAWQVTGMVVTKKGHFGNYLVGCVKFSVSSEKVAHA